MDKIIATIFLATICPFIILMAVFYRDPPKRRVKRNGK